MAKIEVPVDAERQKLDVDPTIPLPAVLDTRRARLGRLPIAAERLKAAVT